MQFIGLGKVDPEVPLRPRAPNAVADVAFDVAEQGGRHASDPRNISPMHGYCELLGDRRDQFVWSPAEVPPQPAVETIETRPQGEPQQRCGVFGPGTAALGLSDQGRESVVFLVGIAPSGMEEIQKRVLVQKSPQLGSCLSNAGELLRGRK